jgi:hypothetical protein
VRECTTEPRCVDFSVLADGTNPRIEQGHTIEVFDHLGNPQPGTEVPTWGPVTGLHLWFRSTIALAAPTGLVRVTIAHFSTGATVTAFDGGGTQVAQATVVGPQGVPIEVTLAAPGITRLEIDCPNDENLLVKLCVEDGAEGTSGDQPHSA